MLESLLRPIRISNFFLREWGKRAPLEREPIKQVLIQNPDLVKHYDQSGKGAGDLVPTYHFNALALSTLLPKGGQVLDLGCGSARMLIHMAKRRTDIKLIGIEQSKPMFLKAKEAVNAENLSSRIKLLHGNMLKAHEMVNERLDVVACILSAHCLRNDVELQQWLKALRVLKFRNNCSIWIFDFARPKSDASCKFFPRFFGNKAGPEMQALLGKAMRASFTQTELADHLDALGIGPFAHFTSGPMPFFQVHRLRSEKHFEITQAFWRHEPLPKMALSHYKTLKAQFPKSILR